MMNVDVRDLMSRSGDHDVDTLTTEIGRDPMKDAHKNWG